MMSLLILFFAISIVFSFLCSLWEAVLLSITPSYAEMRLQQLELNLRRIQRLLYDHSESRYILVKAPAFQLEAVERYEGQQRHRVIAGRPKRQTPEIRATILGLNFFP